MSKLLNNVPAEDVLPGNTGADEALIQGDGKLVPATGTPKTSSAVGPTTLNQEEEEICIDSLRVGRCRDPGIGSLIDLSKISPE
jgi:hypothetical protein